MEFTRSQYKRIEHCFPKARGKKKIDNYDILRAILYIAENGCKWRALPKEFGNWHTIYTRMNRWSKNGVLDRVFMEIQKEQIVKVSLNVLSLDSTSIKVHPDACGCLKKAANNALEDLVVEAQQKSI